MLQPWIPSRFQPSKPRKIPVPDNSAGPEPPAVADPLHLRDPVPGAAAVPVHLSDQIGPGDSSLSIGGRWLQRQLQPQN